MKKVITILFILVNALLFFNTREVFMQQDQADMLRLPVFHPDAMLTTLRIGFFDDSHISPEVSEAMFERFEELTTEYDLVIFGGGSEGFHQINWYVASSIPIDERFNLITGVSVNFNENTTYFYTNHHNVANGVHFFLLNNQLEVQLQPMRAMGQIRTNGWYFFASTNQETLDTAVGLFIDEFSEYASITEALSDPFMLEDEIASFLPPTIIMTMMLVFLIIIMYVHLYSKKIAIFKTMGLSYGVAVKELFLPLFIIITVTIAATQTLLFFFVIGVINHRTIPIIEALINMGFWQLVGMMVTFAISSLLLLLIPSYAMLKNSSLNRLLMGANYIAKIVVLLLILPTISDRIDLMQEPLQRLNHVRHYEQNGDFKHYQFSPWLLSRYNADGYIGVLMGLSGEFFENPDPNIIYEHDILYQYHLAYQILNEAGAILSDSSTFFSGEPVLNVNENYIRKHHIIDLDGNIVDLNQTSSDTVHLVPEMYLGRGFVGDIINRGDDVIPIKNDQIVFDYSLGWDFQGIREVPYVISVARDGSFDLQASPLSNVFFDGDFN